MIQDRKGFGDGRQCDAAFVSKRNENGGMACRVIMVPLKMHS